MLGGLRRLISPLYRGQNPGVCHHVIFFSFFLQLSFFVSLFLVFLATWFLEMCVCVCVCLVHVLTHCTQLYTIRKHNLHGDVSLREKKHVLTNCVLANGRRLSGILIFS